jgi:hypothetical protein
MSSPLAIAAVTAALKDLLNDGMLNHDLSSVGSFSVSALPPDRIATGQTEPNQLNLFLYQVTANQGWRNADMPSRDAAGQRITNPPLALDLHYLLTAYGAEDMNAEVLLGYAMHLLHETPVLTRAALRAVLAPVDPVDGGILPGPFGTLSAIDLADQVEMVKITPAFLSGDDLSKMWTAMQARYRPSIAYVASVVLIQGTAAARVAPPVLARGAQDRGPTATAEPAPTLTGARAAASNLLPAPRLGDDLLLSGTRLNGPGTITAVLADSITGREHVLPPLVPPTARDMTVHLPTPAQDATAMDGWSVGPHLAFLRVARPNSPVWSTNAVPFVLAPSITVAPNAAAAGDFTVTVTCAPRIRSAQESGVRLLWGSTTVTPASITTPVDPTAPTTLTFDLTGVTAGEYLVRLRVGGIDSLPVRFTGTPPRLEFDPAQRVTVA